MHSHVICRIPLKADYRHCPLNNDRKIEISSRPATYNIIIDLEFCLHKNVERQSRGIRSHAIQRHRTADLKNTTMGNSSSSNISPSPRTSNERSHAASNLSNSISGSMSHLSSRITGGGSNNNATHIHRPNIQLPSSLPSPFRSGTGSLGLTKAELDARCQPSGLYPTCEWDPKAIRRLIGDGKLAARLKGSDSRATKSDRECPICFMYYSENNVTKCCEATICTECFLQIKPQRDKYTTCPFCNNPRMSVSVQKGMDEDAIAKRDEDEQRVIEAIIRNRVAQVNGEAPSPRPLSQSSSLMNEASDGEQTFGSSLEQYNRSRTFSNSSSAVSEGSASDPGGNNGSSTPKRPVNDEDALMFLAMSPDARRELEREMRAQLSHETHQRMVHEAEEERMRHAEEWSRSDSGIRSRMREARIAELTQLLERMSGRDDGGGDGEGVQDEGDSTEGAGRGDESFGGLLRALESYGSDRRGANRGDALENLMRLEAALLLGSGTDDNSRRRMLLNRRTSPARLGNENDDGNGPFSLGGSPRRVIRALPRRGVSTTHMDTAEMLMRGISEEDQLAMAIAMSMMDSETQQEEQQQVSEHESQNQEGEAEATGEHHLSDLENAEQVRNESINDSTHGALNNEINNTSASTTLDEDEEEVVFETE
eukprot:CCRYP_002929-RA/>CCRYP_002929-RA protein AED:0.03 eAED:0.03 QI:32/1/1/1/1/1/2/189/653